MAEPVHYGFPGTMDAAALAKWAPHVGSSRYGALGAGDCKASIMTNLDRGVSLAAGTVWGDGVMTVFSDINTLSLPAPASGSVWHLIVARRDWSLGGTTVFASIAGSGNKALPAYNVDAGILSDQPIALARVTAGQTVVQELIDLRCWTGAGGGLYAADDLARTYLTDPGTRVVIGGIDWVRVLDAGGAASWLAIGSVTKLAPNGVSGYAVTGGFSIVTRGQSTEVVCDITIKRTGGNITIAGDDYSGLSAIVPSAARGASETKYLIVGISGAPTQLAIVAVNTATGQLSIKGLSADFTWKTGTLLSVNCAWTF